MKIEALIRKYWLALVVLALIVIIVDPSLVGIHSLGIGYLTGTQGLEVQFDSIYNPTTRTYQGLYGPLSNFASGWYSATEKPAGASASSMTFGYNLIFDPDDPNGYMPKLGASEQTITLDTNIAPELVGGKPWQVKTGSTTFANGTIADVYQQFEIYRYHCTWRFGLWLAGNEWEALGCSPNPTMYEKSAEHQNNYAGTSIWLKIVPKNPLFWQGNDPTNGPFFAPDYVVMRQPVEWASYDGKSASQKTTNDPEISQTESTYPMAEGEPLGIYYTRGAGTYGSGSTNDEPKMDPLQYQGVMLDTSIFRNEYWAHIDLMTFKAWNSFPWLGMSHSWKYPSGLYTVDFFIYVVGEWTVYFKTGEVPALTPHPPQYGTTDWLGAWFSNPFNQLWVLLVTGLAVFIIIEWRQPQVITGVLKRRLRK